MLSFPAIRQGAIIGGIAPKALRINLDFMNARWLKRAGAIEAGVEAVRSGEPCCVRHLVLARSSRVAVSPRRE
jgi:hypothetical protein